LVTPNFTAEALFRFVPLITTVVPPAIGPLVGEIPETAGAIALTVKVKVAVVLPPVLVAVTV